MMRVLSWVVLAGVLGTALNAGLAYFDMLEAQAALNERVDQLEEARRLHLKNPGLLESSSKPAALPDLKRLAQESSAQFNIALVYLNQSEKEVGEDLRERNVVMRAVNVGHAAWIQFLAALEEKGEGARIKEVRVRPLPGRNDAYQDAEAVYSLRRVVEKDATRAK